MTRGNEASTGTSSIGVHLCVRPDRRVAREFGQVSHVQLGNVTMPDGPIKLAVLASGGGRTVQNFIDESQSGRLGAEVGLVIASRAGIGAIERAAAAKVMNFVVERRDYETAEAFSKHVFALCDDAKADLIVLAGWLSLLIIPPKYQGRMMNIHPALLPSFGGKGMYGLFVHEAVINYGCKVSGCTVHFVDATYDTGPIIIQRTCTVQDDDTPDTLAARVFEQEKIAYPQAVRWFAEGRLSIQDRRVLVRA